MARTRKSLSPETVDRALNAIDSLINLRISEQGNAADLAPWFAARQELLSHGGTVETENGGNGAVKTRKRTARVGRALGTNELEASEA